MMLKLQQAVCQKDTTHMKHHLVSPKTWDFHLGLSHSEVHRELGPAASHIFSAYVEEHRYATRLLAKAIKQCVVSIRLIMWLVHHKVSIVLQTSGIQVPEWLG